MKTLSFFYICFLIFAFGSILRAQQMSERMNFQSPNGEDFLSRLRSLQVGSWSLQGNEKERHYKLLNSEIFEKFGFDGVGYIGTDALFPVDELVGVQLIVIKALEQRTTELRETTQRLTETTDMLRNYEAENQRSRQQLETLQNKISEMEGAMMDLKNKVEMLEQKSNEDEK